MHLRLTCDGRDINDLVEISKGPNDSANVLWIKIKVIEGHLVAEAEIKASHLEAILQEFHEQYKDLS